jgi:DNA-binding response OmpR family regulator
MKILLIEDDEIILRTNCKALELQGYHVLCANTLAKGLELLKQNSPNLIVLDILLPDGSGLEFCENVRLKSNVPVLFLSALNTNKDIVEGLQSGGNFYLSKPYDMDVFLAQIKAMLRFGNHDNSVMIYKDLTLDPISRRVCLDGKDILIRPREFALLEVLVKNKGCFMSAEKLYKSVWGMQAVKDTRTVKEHISRLRQKLGNSSIRIESERGRGYRV